MKLFSAFLAVFWVTIVVFGATRVSKFDQFKGGTFSGTTFTGTAFSGTTGTFSGVISSGNLQLSTNSLLSTNTDGNIIFNPNGSGLTIFNDLTATTVPYLGTSKELLSSSVTPTELGYLSGVTSALQTQLGAKLDEGNFAVSGNVLSSTDTNGNITLTPDGSGIVESSSNFNILTQGELRLQDTTGGEYIGFKAPGTVTSSTSFTLPNGDGSNGQILSTNGSGVLSWANDAGGSALVLTTVSKTANYTALTSDDVIFCDSSGGAFTITLYTASGNSGYVITITKTSTSTPFVTVDGNGSETIGGSLTTLLKTQNSGITLVSDGTNWQIKEDSRPRYYSFLISNNGTASVSNDVYDVVNSPGRGSTGSGSLTYTTSFFTNAPNVMPTFHGAADSSTMPQITIGSFSSTGFDWVTNKDANGTRSYVDNAFGVTIFDRDFD